MKKAITLLTMFLLAGALAVGFAQDQTQPSQTQPSQEQTNQATPNPQPPTTSQPSDTTPTDSTSTPMQGSSFTGMIVKTDDGYTLKTSDMTYQLDDQEKAKQFAGQNVKVSGTLDTNTNMIHVSDINPAT